MVFCAKPRAVLERMGVIVNQFTTALHGVCYCVVGGDFRGPPIGAAGTQHFEPDGVIFWVVPYRPSRRRCVHNRCRLRFFLRSADAVCSEAPNSARALLRSAAFFEFGTGFLPPETGAPKGA
jgi:hypothetical protein